jgi:hypothetical protein
VPELIENGLRDSALRQTKVCETPFKKRPPRDWGHRMNRQVHGAPYRAAGNLGYRQSRRLLAERVTTLLQGQSRRLLAERVTLKQLLK